MQCSSSTLENDPHLVACTVISNVLALLFMRGVPFLQNIFVFHWDLNQVAVRSQFSFFPFDRCQNNMVLCVLVLFLSSGSFGVCNLGF